uniref:Uncharacterized protein n=1 Tax=Arundo donax TaxID=35708 RepID=A0A0A9GMV1_ARUDO
MFPPSVFLSDIYHFPLQILECLTNKRNINEVPRWMILHQHIKDDMIFSKLIFSQQAPGEPDASYILIAQKGSAG